MNASTFAPSVSEAQALGAPLDLTTINQSGYERQGGVRTGEMAFTSVFDPASLGEHDALSPLSTGDVIMTYFDGPLGIGNMASSLVAKQVNYDPNRAADGSLTIPVQCLGNAFAKLGVDKITDTDSHFDSFELVESKLYLGLHGFALFAVHVCIMWQGR